MLLYYHGKLSWVTRISGLPYSQREIRYGARVVLVFVPNWASSGHRRRRMVATLIRATNT
eukprot:scaffold4191_cov76-Skeletonema_dohrnii-CCMP3373.AAC.7